MSSKHCSNSELQVEIEKIQIKKLEKELNYSDLSNDAFVYFKHDDGSKIKPDIYSEKHHIIGEVYTHLGKLKPSQMHKVTSDILKLILFNKDSGSNFEMYYVVCDETVKDCMLKNSVIRNAVRLYEIHVACFPLDESMKEKLKETMKKQDLTKSHS